VTTAAEYRHSHWGILVVDSKDGSVVFEQNADLLFLPASVTKCFSTAAALAEFGPDYRWITPLRRRGEVDAKGVLRGDLILVCSGDLSLGGRTLPDGSMAFANYDHTYANSNDKAEITTPDPLQGLNQLAGQAAAAGIREVTGEVMIDSRLFEASESTGSGPARVTPIVINDNLIDLVITPGEAGKPAGVTWRPQSALIHVDASVDTVAADGPLSTTLRWTEEGLILRGTIPAGRKPLVRVAEFPNPDAFARSLLIEALQRAGVKCAASPLAPHPGSDALPTRSETAGLPLVASLTSPPASEQFKLVLKVSHNLHASTLPLLLAVRHNQRTVVEGLKLQRAFLESVGVDVNTISFGGGAGGAGGDCVTPRATVQLLQGMSRRPDGTAYRAAMPILGVDGTLVEAVASDSPARGKVQAKTGTFYHDNTLNGRVLLTSKALAGYLKTAAGRELTFAMFVNNVHLENSTAAARVGKTLGRLCEIIHESDKPAAPPQSPATGS
jgi:D-alanyl-D-alanine carboxypeptidase/D-alanyl-D-alanine-endopeptidase (penicillin-binding protein 4)